MKVYLFRNSMLTTGDQVWLAVAENGIVITSHISSNRSWGIHDVGPDWKKKDYEDALGENFDVDIVILDDGEAPPQNVLYLHLEREKTRWM